MRPPEYDPSRYRRVNPLVAAAWMFAPLLVALLLAAVVGLLSW